MFELQDGEIAKDVLGYENYYQITNFGRLWSKRSNRFLKPILSPSGHPTIITKLGGRKSKSITFRIRQLVADSFVENPKNKPKIKHIDGNYKNNFYQNLMWFDPKEERKRERENIFYEKNAKLVCEIHGLTNFSKHHNGNAIATYRCNKCQAERVKKIIDEKKARVYKRYGNKCNLCGYDKCLRALDFHHLDPTKKEITPNKVFSRSWERIIIELDKCILLCANCHREVHDGITKIPKDFKIVINEN